jgi:hypothetical protein
MQQTRPAEDLICMTASKTGPTCVPIVNVSPVQTHGCKDDPRLTEIFGRRARLLTTHKPKRPSLMGKVLDVASQSSIARICPIYIVRP